MKEGLSPGCRWNIKGGSAWDAGRMRRVLA